MTERCRSFRPEMFIDLTNIDVGVSPRAAWSLERCRNKWLQIVQHIYVWCNFNDL